MLMDQKTILLKLPPKVYRFKEILSKFQGPDSHGGASASPALRMLRQEDCQFEDSLGYITRLYLKKFFFKNF
jgi:hypothetical protein